MGYYTGYSLTYEILEQEQTEMEKFIDQCEMAGIPVPNRVGNRPNNMEAALHDAMSEDKLPSFSAGNFDDCKWYEHEDVMKAFSAKWPTVLFTLKGEGEESGDMWYKYFLGGKMQVARAVVSFATFDKDKLK